jgi:hypothetical protein
MVRVIVACAAQKVAAPGDFERFASVRNKAGMSSGIITNCLRVGGVVRKTAILSGKSERMVDRMPICAARRFLLNPGLPYQGVPSFFATRRDPFAPRRLPAAVPFRFAWAAWWVRR